MQLSDFDGLPIVGNPGMLERGVPSKVVRKVTGPDGPVLMCHPARIAELEAAIARERQRVAWANFKAEIIKALHVREAVDWLARVLPAPGFCGRVRNRLILMRHPNYRNFKRHLIGVWSGK